MRQFADGDGFRDAYFARNGGDGFFKFAAFALAFAFVAAFAATAAGTGTATATVIAVTTATAFAAAFSTAAARAAFARLDVEARFGFFFVVFAFGDVFQRFLPLPFEFFVFFSGAFFPLFLFAQFFGSVALGVFRFAYFPLFFLLSQLRGERFFGFHPRLFGVLGGFFFLFFAGAACFFFGSALAFGVLRFFTRARFAVAHRLALGQALLFGHLLCDFARA